MYLLDTNVISELRKVRSGRAEQRVEQWADSVQAIELFLSVITVHELELGVVQIQRRDEKQGALLRVWLDKYVLPAFAGRILDITTPVAICSASLHVPDPKPVRDAFIAATAIVNGMKVVTRNTADFELMGADLFNPWT
jgi:predicted nucleic acid-binding protein